MFKKKSRRCWGFPWRRSTTTRASHERRRGPVCGPDAQWGMHTGRFVFAELIAHLPHKEFQKCVTRYDGDHHRRSFSCWDRYLAMAFAQFTYRESLRDIEACLGAMQGKLYQIGFRGKVARTDTARH